ncbi:LamB/YcsF family protein, partial [Calditerricola satsumensis]
PRRTPGALILDPEVAAEQVVRLVKEGKVRSLQGPDVAVRADTVCLHGDGERAVEFARAIRARLTAEGITVKAVGAK